MILAGALEMKSGGVDEKLGCDRLIISARDIRRMFITYVKAADESAVGTATSEVGADRYGSSAPSPRPSPTAAAEAE